MDLSDLLSVTPKFGYLFPEGGEQHLLEERSIRFMINEKGFNKNIASGVFLRKGGYKCSTQIRLTLNDNPIGRDIVFSFLDGNEFSPIQRCFVFRLIRNVK